MIKESILNMTDRGLKALFALVFLVLLGNYATTEVFGMMMLMLVYRQVSLVVCSLGSDNYVLQKIATEANIESKIRCFLEHFILRIMIVIMLCILVITFGEKNQFLIILSGGLLALSSLIENYNRARSQTHYNVIAYFVVFLCIFFFYYEIYILGEINFHEACRLLFIESLIGFIALFSYFLFSIKGRAKKLFYKLDFSFQRPYILISLCFSAVIAILQSRVDILMLEQIGSLAEVAELGLAARLTALLFIPLVAFNTVLIVKANKVKSNKVGSPVFYKTNQLSVLFVYILIALSCALFYLIFPIVFDDKYINALNLFYVYVLTLIPSSILHLQTVWYYQEKLIMFALYKNIVTLFLTIVFLYYMIPLYGVYGAAWSMVLCGFINAYILNLFNKKTLRMLKCSYRCLFLYNVKFLKKGS
jgi:O-antigen/teichoic acid export membrane protein